MVDEIDQRILGVLTDSGREMTVSEVMDELMAIYGEPYRRCRIRNRLQTLVKFRYCTSREATESIRGKPTRFYGIWRRERMTYYDYPLLFDSKMDLGTFVETIRKLADADIDLELETMCGCDDGKIYVEAEGREWDEVKAAIDSIPGVEIDMATMTEWALDCDSLESERMKHRISPRPVPRRDRDAEDYINRNRLNNLVSIDEWILESAVKNGRNTYLPRKWLAESYAILDAVRHVGPRRRAEIEAATRITDDDKRMFRESWEYALGHPIGNEELSE